MTTNASSDEPYISICCNRNELSSSDSSCYRDDYFSDGMLFLPDIYDSNLSISSMSPYELLPRFGIPCANEINYLNINSESVHETLTFLLENGTIYVHFLVNSLTDFHVDYRLDIDDYCFSPYEIDNETITVISVCGSYMDNFLETHPSLLGFMEAQPPSLTDLFYMITLGLSIPFFAATFIAYTIIPELKNIHGFILRAYVACFFVTHILVIVSLVDMRILCAYFLSFFLQFTILASFFWMNVGCFDIWLTFRSLKGGARQWSRKKCIIYSIYAWGSAALITGVGAIIDFVPTVPKGIIRPGLHNGCWFNDITENTIYLYAPMAITIICNACLCALTAVKIIRQKKEAAAHLEGSENRRTNDKQQSFNLYLKLFVVMGMAWTSELITHWESQGIPEYIAFIIDIPNTLQGVAIFIISVWNDKNRRLLFQRLGCKDRNVP